MPVYAGGGSGGPRGARYTQPQHLETPAVRATRPTYSSSSVLAPSFAPAFAHAQRQAARNVSRAIQRMPAQPVPRAIPRLPNPTPAQIHAALSTAHESMRHAIGPNPSRARIGEYQQELANDPRLRDFRETLQHYTRLAEAHLSSQRAERAHQDVAPAGLKQPAWWADPLQRMIHQGLEESKLIGSVNREAAIARGEADKPKSHMQFGLPGLATVDIGPTLAALAGAHVIPGGNVLSKIGNELIDLPAQSFLSGALTGSSLRRGIQKGEWTPAEQIAKGFARPFTHPLASAKESPLTTLLMLAGGENAVARLAGRAGRFATADGGLGARFAESGRGAPRANLKLTPGEEIVARRYNPDPLRALLQRGYEKAQPKLPGPLRQADPFQASGHRLQRELVGGAFKVGRVDRIAAAGEEVRRTFAKGLPARLDQLKPKVGADVVHGLAQENVVRSPASAIEDLQKVKALWEQAQPNLEGSQLKINKANLAKLHAVLEHPDVVAHGGEALRTAIEGAQQGERPIQQALRAELVHGGKLHEEQLRAALFPYAQTHMGAKRGEIVPPHLQSAYEAGLSEYRDSAKQVQVMENRLRHAELQRARVGRRAFASETTRAREGGGSAIAAADARVRGAKDSLRMAKVAREDAHARVPDKPKPVMGMRNANGAYLPDEAILAHMHANGLEPPGFLSHRRGIAGRSSFFKTSLKAPPAESHARAGEAFLNGTADYSWEGVRGNLARMASEASQLQVRRSRFRRLGYKPEGQDGNGFYTLDGAKQEADAFNTSPQGEEIKAKLGEVVPVHVGSGQIVEKGHVAAAHTTNAALEQFGLAPHAPADAALNGRYVLMPRNVADRLKEHDEALGAGSPHTTTGRIRRALQLYQQGFRRAKLNLSMPHQFGVLQEQLIRLGAEAPGSGPIAGAAGRKFTRVLGEMAGIDRHGVLVDSRGPNGELFREYAATIANRGGLSGSQRANDVVRKGDQFVDAAGPSTLGYLAHGAEGAQASRLGHAAGAPWRAWKTVFEGGLAKAEHGTRSALLGKALKQSGLIDSFHELIRMQDAGVKALIAGKMDHNMADSLARAVDDMGGNWNRQTPFVRKLVGNYAPFGLWWLNSMRWLYRLPVTHPVKTAIAAGLYQATREMRASKGQGFDAAHPVPTFLQGSIESDLPLVGKGHIAPSYYSPGGTLGPEWGNTLVSQLAPALQGPIAAAQGINPLSHRRLETAGKKPLGPLDIATNVLSEIIGGPMPGSSQLEKVLTRGGKPYGTSNLLTDLLWRAGLGSRQVKKGTERPWLQVLGKLVSPTRFDFPTTGTGTGAGGGSSSYSPAQQREIEQAVKAAEGSGAQAGYTPAELREIERLAAGR